MTSVMEIRIPIAEHCFHQYASCESSPDYRGMCQALHGTRRKGPRRHQTQGRSMRAVWHHSWHLLSPLLAPFSMPTFFVGADPRHGSVWHGSRREIH